MVSETIMSPRSNLSHLLERTLGGGSQVPEAEQSAATSMLVSADAQNKLRHQKLYLVLDLDETLVYTRRMAPNEVAVGNTIYVRGQPFDMILRPGLRQFLKVATLTFTVYLYTMGDEEYTQAVLNVIDPDRKLFTGTHNLPAPQLPPLNLLNLLSPPWVPPPLNLLPPLNSPHHCPNPLPHGDEENSICYT